MTTVSARDVHTSLASAGQAGLVGRLLFEFNTEFETEGPTAEELGSRFFHLLLREDVLVVLSDAAGDGARAGATGFAFLTLRPTPYYDGMLAQLEELYVVPDLRDQGIGTALLTHAVSEARARGAAEMHINVDEIDSDTRRFYERHQFVNIEPGENYRMLCYVREFGAEAAAEQPDAGAFAPGWEWRINDQIDWTLPEFLAAAERGSGDFPSLDEIEFWFEPDDIVAGLTQVTTAPGRAMMLCLAGRLQAHASVPEVLAGLSDSDAHVRFRAAEALSRLYTGIEQRGRTQATSALFSLWLTETEPWVRGAVVEALVSTSRRDAIPLLREASWDSSEVVRRSAEWGLLRLTGASDLPPGENDQAARPVVTGAHPGQGEHWTVRQLVSTADSAELDFPGTFWASTHFDGLQLAEALDAVTTRRGRQRLLDLCGEALADESRSTAITCLAAAEPGIRTAAARTLGKLYGLQVWDVSRLETLQELVRAWDVEEDPACREALVTAIARVGRLDALPILRQALSDEDSDVVRTASTCLALLTAAEPVHPSSP